MRNFFPVLLISALILGSCGGPSKIKINGTDEPARVLPYPVEYPIGYVRALQNRTRAKSGEPGPTYWQQFSEYHIQARLFPDEKKLEGRANITYYNNSPDTLFTLHLELAQNHHAPGVMRNEPAEITGGMHISRVVLNGNTLQGNIESGERFEIDGTRMRIRTGRALLPGQFSEVEIEYNFKIPQAGISGRMGYSRDNLFYLGYWYPQMVVYDDVVGWHPDPYLGMAEFYHGFADYKLEIQAPAQWIVMATGSFQNPDEVLQPQIVERMRTAWESDEIHNVVSGQDFNNVTKSGDENGWLTWRFNAKKVRDVAFSATKESIWDASRTPVGDLNGDGQLNYTKINTFWRQDAPLWSEVTDYQKHAIRYLSEMTGYPYPWPHMTAVEGSGIIGGGMEFPMMTIMGDYNNLGARRLYGVTAHELAHMWVPLIVSTDERRYSWLDEGNTSFSTNEALNDFYPGTDAHANTRRVYITFAQLGREGEMMRQSDYHYSAQAFGVASYQKPATVLQALRGVLGEDIFWSAYRTFINEWAFKQAYPWDMFATFERVSERDLSWFWRSWYYETWFLDHEIQEVTETEKETIIIIRDRGTGFMPVQLTITHQNGRETTQKIGVEYWLEGNRTLEIRLGETDIQRLEIDAGRLFPDIERRNNVWVRQNEKSSDTQQ